MDLAVYDRRARRVRMGLAVCLTVSLAVWYVGDFHPELLHFDDVRWLPYALMLVAMTVLGAYADGLIAELRVHAAETHRRGEEARILASRDQLTGALNRATFLEGLGRHVRAAKEGPPVALFLLDLDRFKAMNDIFGHAFGDAVLKRVGQVLTREIGADKIGRLGGDEFGFLLTGPVSKSTCEAVGARVLSALAEPTILLGRTAQIEGSIGVAWSPEHDLDRLDLMACADLALYLAKQGGRRRVACFDRDLMKEERYRRSIERELRGAILTNELDMHYQPIVEIAGGRVHALEALVRWRHPVRGVISPAEFIPVAEQTPLIEPLGRWVLTRVCSDAARWPNLQIGINVSPAQLKRREFVATMREVLAETGCDPARIAIEITEGLLMDGGAEQVAHLNELRSLGVGIWLDDFGAGFSGLSYLRDFPIDVIKIDKSFVHDMRTAHANRVFVSTIAQMGRGLDKLVIAEGIENDDDLAMVRAAGCAHGQGFHFARPMPAGDVSRYLEERLSEKAA